MSKKSTYVLGILATIIIGSFLYHKFCCSSDGNISPIKENSTPANANSGTLNQLSLFSLKGKGIDFSSHDNFNFSRNGFTHFLPVPDSIDLGLSSLKTIFDKGGQKLRITGFATAEEMNNSSFPNLGFARANGVKDYFISKGFLDSDIEINGEIRDNLSFKNDTLFGPLSFMISEKDNTATTDWTALKEKINTNPLIFYFKTGQAYIIASKEDHQKVADISNYLNHVEDAKLEAVGHTDNKGNADTNIRLGQKRADFAKSYLVKNGIVAEKINTSSKGPAEPMNDNSTKEGQAKNRCVVVKIN
ncbi:OmpA family protein [Flavobacterium sp. W1B]|uniref:OmpA family protein n=1 Tax=Flavobacterium sp. W1B TaxID=3394146 RepID=UPI0039BCC810